jgi:8-oxo-dGTP diphosphatase
VSEQFKERFKFLAGAIIILRKDNKILLHRRQNTGWMDGYYALIGGGIDGGETVIQAGAREAFEELGIKIDPETLKVVHVAHGHFKDDCEGFSFFLEACEWNGEPKIMEPDKSDDLVWVDVNELPKNTIPHVKSVLEFIEQNVFYSSLGFGKCLEVYG